MGNRSLVILVMLAVVLTACAPQANPAVEQRAPAAPSKPTLLRVGFGEQIITFGSRLVETRGRLDPVINAYLVRTDDRAVNHPYLAERIPSQDEGTWIVNPDGTMRTVWTLRQEAKWHDGEPVTAHDVVFAHRLYRDRELQITTDVPERYITSVVARDERTFEVHWDRPYFEAGQPSARDLVPLPRHLLESQYNSLDKQAFNNLTFWTSEEYVGAGPFRVTQVSPGVSLTVTANPQHVLGRPKIDNIEFRVIPERNTLVAQLLAGEIDFVGHAHLQAEGAAILQERWQANGEGKINVTLWEPFVMTFQQKDVPNHQPALRDVRVRQALVHAMDREALAVQQTAGMATGAETLVAPSHVLFPRIDSAISKYPFDPRRALQLLGEAGWTRAADGALRNAAGQLLDVEIISTPSTQKNGVVIADYWKQVGVEVRFDNLTEPQRTDVQRRSNYPGVDVSAPTDYRAYTTGEISAADNQWRKLNQAGWSDPGYDVLFARFDRSLNPAERDDLTVELERLTTTMVLQARLNYVARPSAYLKHVSGTKGMNPNSTYMWNTDEWTVQ
jgi:peptide/nickel transport system substrate-binding protein